MKVIKGSTIFCDIDQTLVDLRFGVGTEDLKEDELILDYYGSKVKILPNYELIEQLKLHKQNGYSIVLWSGAGERWAKNVAKVLKLEKVIDLAITKPQILYDDCKSEDLLLNIKHIRPSMEENLKQYAQKSSTED